MGSLIVTAELALCLIVAIAIPIATMWAASQFVGQRRPPFWFKRLVYLVAVLGLLYGVLHSFTGSDFQTLLGGLALAWVAGSVITALVGLQEMLDAKRGSGIAGKEDPPVSP